MFCQKVSLQNFANMLNLSCVISGFNIANGIIEVNQKTWTGFDSGERHKFKNPACGHIESLNVSKKLNWSKTNYMSCVMCPKLPVKCHPTPDTYHLPCLALFKTYVSYDNTQKQPPTLPLID